MNLTEPLITVTAFHDEFQFTFEQEFNIDNGQSVKLYHEDTVNGLVRESAQMVDKTIQLEAQIKMMRGNQDASEGSGNESNHQG